MLWRWQIGSFFSNLSQKRTTIGAFCENQNKCLLLLILSELQFVNFSQLAEKGNQNKDETWNAPVLFILRLLARRSSSLAFLSAPLSQKTLICNKNENNFKVTTVRSVIMIYIWGLFKEVKFKYCKSMRHIGSYVLCPNFDQISRYELL